MIDFGIVALIWPFFMIGFVVGMTLLAQAMMDRRERRQHPAE
jgi:hypothetical protein